MRHGWNEDDCETELRTYVQTQCMYATQSSRSTSSLVYLLCIASWVNVVIGVLVVHGELLVVVRVVPVFLDCDAVVHRIRSQSTYTVAIVFMLIS